MFDSELNHQDQNQITEFSPWSKAYQLLKKDRPLNEGHTQKPIYDLSHKERQDLGRERVSFEEWESLDFGKFLEIEIFRTPEAVVGFFLDHPQVNPRDVLLELFLDGQYKSFVQDYFRNLTKLNPKALGQEISRVVEQLSLERKRLKEEVNELNAQGEQAIAYQLGRKPFDVKESRLLFLPSLEVFDYIVHGASKKNSTNRDSLGGASSSYPIIKEQNASDNFFVVQRIGFIPMSYKVDIHTTKIQVSEQAGNGVSEVESSHPWKDIALRLASHETEHVRVRGQYNPQSQEIEVGFKSLPNRNWHSPKDINVRGREKERDEGMTDFISVWKLLIRRGDLSAGTDWEQVLNKVDQAKAAEGLYFSEILSVIQDMKEYQERYREQNPLEVFLKSYYVSSEYPKEV